MFNNFQGQVVDTEISSSYTINKTSQGSVFPPQRYISSILTRHLKKSPVTRIHLPIHKSYNTGVCTHSLGNSSIRKAAKYQKYDAPHFSSTSAQVQYGMGPLINMQTSVFLPLWNNYELYGRKILHIESFSATKSENLVRISEFFV